MVIQRQVYGPLCVHVGNGTYAAPNLDVVSTTGSKSATNAAFGAASEEPAATTVRYRIN